MNGNAIAYVDPVTPEERAAGCTCGLAFNGEPPPCRVHDRHCEHCGRGRYQALT